MGMQGGQTEVVPALSKSNENGELRGQKQPFCAGLDLFHA